MKEKEHIRERTGKEDFPLKVGGHLIEQRCATKNAFNPSGGLIFAQLTKLKGRLNK